MNKRYTFFLNIILFVGGFFAFAATALAANFVPLVPVPGINYGDPDYSEYIRIAYIIAIAAAAFLAVGRLIIAGFSYVTSSLTSTKSNAKDDIRSALIGLIIILIAVAVLRTINPELTNLSGTLDPIDVRSYNRPTAEVVTVPTTNESISNFVPRTDGELTDAQLELFMRECGANGGKTVVTMEKLTCQGASVDGVTDRIAQIIDDTTLTQEEKVELLADYNTFLAQADITNTVDVDGILAEHGASGALWVVREPLPGSADFANFVNSVETICNAFGSALGDEGVGHVNGTGYYACLVP